MQSKMESPPEIPQLKMRRREDHDFLAKIVIIGDSSVGKTNLLLRFAAHTYLEAHTPTIGVDFKSKIVEIEVGEKREKKKVKLQLWDTAGQERYRTITQTYYHGAAGIVVVYAIDNRKSFENVKDWLSQIAQHNGDALPKVLVGNKSDLHPFRQVKAEEGRKLAEEKGCLFAEVSAKENVGVDEMFVALASQINFSLRAKKQKEMLSTDSNNQYVVLTTPPASGSCCARLKRRAQDTLRT